jgi:hypothetical protein
MSTFKIKPHARTSSRTNPLRFMVEMLPQSLMQERNVGEGFSVILHFFQRLS